jgi:sugar phosphate isomerase/epimerase
LPDLPVIWLYTPPYRRDNAEELRAALNSQTQTLVLGPSGHPAPEIDLGSNPNLALALETCPGDLRPAACVCLAHDLPTGIDCLPCPVLGWAGGSGLEGRLPDDAQAGGQALLAGMQNQYLPAWLPRVQVNLPLKDLLGRYRPLIQALPINLEVGLDAQALDDLGTQEIEAANLLLEGRRVTAHLAFMDLAPGSRDPKVRELSRQRLLAAAQLAGRIKAEQAVAHLGFDHRTTPEPGEWVERAAPVFAELAETLAELGCRLALENVFEQDPALHLLLGDAMAKLNSNQVGFCLDAGHALAFSATALEDWWQAFKPNLWELHLHDNRGAGDEHLPVGWGAVDWGVIVQGLAQMVDLPVITLEPHREPHLWGSLRGMERLFRISGSACK